MTTRKKPTPPAHLSAGAKQAWKEVTAAHPDPATIVGPELEAYAVAIARHRDAADRIDTEGAIISDERGRPIPHPAFDIERHAQADIHRWAEKFAPDDSDPLGI
ncbi:P27 family phage terminase small subunit [Tomitella fengzijianii]|uniref:P27 family phage terminase small subunit n=1 Tax=Tomitella fengzijianii TaxID=2597660 RepID=A0A516X5L5_9ACTN|nr:P27 family phage terminase small subunit [Tomitella fengzijianii]QDQ97971.1 P27 family phage terminase small subunit [Tomitella fengzijianii]